MTTPDDEKVLTEVQGATGVITLNRPKGLNSMDYDMIKAIDAALRDWATDDAVEQVVIHSAIKHFCSGGDVKFARQTILDGQAELVDEFFAVEYAMNNFLAEFPKPHIALVKGVNMGGGMGVSALGSHFVVEDGAFASMPEMNIGYITDVGMSWKLQHLPGHESKNLGKFLGLTGYRLTPEDMMVLGLATHRVESVDALLDSVIEHGVAALPEPEKVTDAPITRWFDEIERTFDGSWAEIQACLDDADPEFAELVRELTAKASPTALVAAAELFEANANLDLSAALENERVLGELIRREPDFAEGVRAVLVDKDQAASFAPQPDPEKYRAVLT